MTNSDGLVRQTIYHPLFLYSRHMRGEAVDTYVDCDLYDLRPENETSPWPHRVADLGPFKVLDVTAVRDPERQTVDLAVVNRDLTRSVQAAVEIAGMSGNAVGVAYELNGPSVDSFNSFDAPNAVKVVERPLALAGQFTYSFPAHSLTVLRLEPSSGARPPLDPQGYQGSSQGPLPHHLRP